MRSSVLGGALGLALVACGGGGDEEPDAGPPECEEIAPGAVSFNDPTFCLVDVALFVGPAPAGEPLENSLRAVADDVMPGHTWITFNSYYSSDTDPAHAPPYTDEVEEGLAGIGAVATTTFSAADVTAPNALYGVAMIVPNASRPLGRTPDGPDLPVLRDTGAYTVTESLRRLEPDGQPTTLSFAQTSLAGVGAAYEGVSHAPVAWVEQSDTPPAAGEYELYLEISRDPNMGWNITVPFTIE